MITVEKLIEMLEKIEDKSKVVYVIDAVTDIDGQIFDYEPQELFEIDVRKDKVVFS